MYRQENLFCVIDRGPINATERLVTDRGETIEIGLCHFDAAFSGFRWNDERGWEPIFVETCDWVKKTTVLSICSSTQNNPYTVEEIAAELSRFREARGQGETKT